MRDAERETRDAGPMRRGDVGGDDAGCGMRNARHETQAQRGGVTWDATVRDAGCGTRDARRRMAERGGRTAGVSLLFLSGIAILTTPSRRLQAAAGAQRG